VLECVVNISEGRDGLILEALADAAGKDLLDIHSDPDHNRSVFTMIGEDAPRRLAETAVSLMTIANHEGVHPRLGMIDVVPFVPLKTSTMAEAIRARDEFAQWVATELEIPSFLYGPERSLPFIRKNAWTALLPDVGGSNPHDTAGAMCVGAREPLVAYNVWLADVDIHETRRIAAHVRTEHIRTLGLQVGRYTQVSMNLIEPEVAGPDIAVAAVQKHTNIHHTELVGLLPNDVLSKIPSGQWEALDLAEEKTIEWRLENRNWRISR
jgi:glutamate formiminotransferase